MMRLIPETMATQHPDNACAPYWNDNGKPFISNPQEIIEAMECFEGLDIDEYMWDWEGKNADAAVVDRLFSEQFEYFSKHQLGRDKFLTFRIPNIWEEKGYNLLQAMSVILSSEDFARDVQFQHRPLFEVILPMTERAEQVLHMQKLFERLSQFKSLDFTPDRLPNESYLEMIPLIESVGSQLDVKNLLFNYLKLHEAQFARRPKYLRVFLACSDSALTSGFLGGRLGNKLSLARLEEFSQENGIEIYPILGPGSLPFRGGLSPNRSRQFIEEYPGVRTVTVQSAFRYDYTKPEVIKALKLLKENLPKAKPIKISTEDQPSLLNVIEITTNYYHATSIDLIEEMDPIFESMPKRRERRQHIGLLSYSRTMGAKSLPRAITFTGSFYSVGVPPEFIGSGRGLAELTGEAFAMLKSNYPHLKEDFQAAGKYLNKKNLDKLAKKHLAWQDIASDVKLLEKAFGVEFGPETGEEKEHALLSTKLLEAASKSERSKIITDMAVLRRSLG